MLFRQVLRNFVLMKIKIVLLGVLVLANISCSTKNEFEQKLDQAEELMPKSYIDAIKILEELQLEATQRPKNERMRHMLLYAYAQKLNCWIFTSDIKPNSLTDYFDEYGTTNERMLAYSIKGTYHAEKGDWPASHYAYKMAITSADTTSANCDIHLLSRVYRDFALTLEKRADYDKASEAYEQARKYALMAKDSSGAEAFSERNQYLTRNKKVLAESQSWRARSQKKHHTTGIVTYEIYEMLDGYNREVKYYPTREDYEKANTGRGEYYYYFCRIKEEQFSADIKYEPQIYNYYLNKIYRDNYLRLGQIDSALYYHNIVKRDSTQWGKDNFKIDFRHIVPADIKKEDEAESPEILSEDNSDNSIHVAGGIIIAILLFLSAFILRKRVFGKKSEAIQKEEAVSGQADTLRLKTELENNKVLRHFIQMSDKRAVTPSYDDWTQLFRVAEEYYPGFVSKVKSCETISRAEYQVCVLVKLGFRTSDIAFLTNNSLNNVCNMRSRMMEKIFGVKGGSKDFDTKIMEL